MIGKFASLADKAIEAVARNRAALDRSTARLAAHDAVRPAGDDADGLFAWKRERRDLEDRAEADREALAFAEKRAEEARAEAAERTAEAEHAAEDRRAAADVKLLREADALAVKLAGKLAEIEAGRARTAAVNAKRGDRPGIVDAETRVRQRMDPGRPAITQTVEAYVDVAGNRVNPQGRDDEGRVFWRKDVREVEVEEVVVEAIPPRPLPLARLADEIRLVDLEGRQIWPRQ